MNTPVFSLSKSMTFTKWVFLYHLLMNGTHSASHSRDIMQRSQWANMRSWETKTKWVDIQVGYVQGANSHEHSFPRVWLCRVEAAISWNVIFIRKRESWILTSQPNSGWSDLPSDPSKGNLHSPGRAGVHKSKWLRLLVLQRCLVRYWSSINVIFISAQGG